MNRLVQSLVFSLVVLGSALPGVASAQWVDVGSISATPCGTSSGTFYNRYEATAGAHLSSFVHGVFAGSGSTAEFFVYESLAQGGPYNLIWSNATTLAGIGAETSGPVGLNLEPGRWYLLGASVQNTSVSSLSCYLDSAASEVYESFTFGDVNESGTDAYTATMPPTYAPVTSAEVHWQRLTLGPLVYAPVASHGGPYTTLESNPTVTFDASGTTDQDNNITNYIWKPLWGFNNTWALTGVQAPFTYPLQDDAVYDVQLQVVDSTYLSDIVYTTVTIQNEPPTVTAACTGCTADEGDTLSFSCTATDPGADIVSLSWDFGSGFVAGATQANTYPDEGSFTATCQGDDGDGGTDTDAVAVTVSNVAPTLGTVASTPSGNEGDVLSFSTSATDPGPNDILTFTWTWGDGTTSSGASVTKSYGDDGSFTTFVAVDDGDGGNDSSTPVTVTINNVAPVLSVTCPGPLEEGTSLTLGASQFDPGMDTWTWSVSGAPAGMTLTPGAGGTTATLAWTPGFADIAAGSFGFTVTVDDGDGGSDSETCSGIALTYLDVDADGLPDTWEATNSVSDPAGDPDADGRDNATEWAAGTDPNSYDGPDVPTPTSPVGGVDVVSMTPTLTWDNATNGPGDALTYDIEVFSDASGSALVASVVELTEGAGTTSWTVDVALSDNAPGSWRVRASDLYVDGAWSAVTPFFVDLENEPPSVPVLVGPPDGGIVTDAGVDLEIGTSADPEGDDFVYTIEVYSDAALTEQIFAEELAGPAGAIRSFTEAAEDTLYWWRARAVDVEGEASEWAGPWRLLWSTVDDAPPAPTFLWPEDDGQSASDAPVFELEGAADPEALPVAFELELSQDEAFSAPIASGPLLEDTPGAVIWDSSTVTTPYAEDAVGWARARAIDPGGLESEWTTISFTPNAQNDPPTAPTLESPVGGVDVSGVVELVIGNATDPDGNRRSYEFEVRNDGEFVWGGSVDEAPGGTRVTVTGGSLDAGSYSWRARALDDLDLPGPWAEEAFFTYVVPTDDDDSGDDSGEDETEGCACESSLVAQDGGPAALVLGALVLGRRRRR